MKYYLAEYQFGNANLAEFEGEKLNKSYRANRATFKELYGSLWIARSGLVVETDDKVVFKSLRDAVTFLVEQGNKNIKKLEKRIDDIRADRDGLFEILENGGKS